MFQTLKDKPNSLSPLQFLLVRLGILPQPGPSSACQIPHLATDPSLGQWPQIPHLATDPSPGHKSLTWPQIPHLASHVVCQCTECWSFGRL